VLGLGGGSDTILCTILTLYDEHLQYSLLQLIVVTDEERDLLEEIEAFRRHHGLTTAEEDEACRGLVIDLPSKYPLVDQTDELTKVDESWLSSDSSLLTHPDLDVETRDQEIQSQLSLIDCFPSTESLEIRKVSSILGMILYCHPLKVFFLITLTSQLFNK